MSDRDAWIARAREAFQGDGDPALRALTILEAAQRLAPSAENRAEKLSLVKLTRATLAMAGLTENDLRQSYVLSDIAQAWLAFENAWSRP